MKLSVVSDDFVVKLYVHYSFTYTIKRQNQINYIETYYRIKKYIK